MKIVRKVQLFCHCGGVYKTKPLKDTKQLKRHSLFYPMEEKSKNYYECNKCNMKIIKGGK